MTNKTKNSRKKNVKEVVKIFAYKVFKQPAFDSDLLLSRSVKGRLRKEYRKNKKTEANPIMFEAGFGLCIFTELEKGQRFLRERGGVLYKVEVGQIIDPPKERPSIDILPKIVPKEDTKTSYRAILKRFNKIDEYMRRDSWPTGTMMTDWCIPIEKIG